MRAEAGMIAAPGARSRGNDQRPGRDLDAIVGLQSLQYYCEPRYVERVWRSLACAVPTRFEHAIVEVEAVHREHACRRRGVLVELGAQVLRESALAGAWCTGDRDQSPRLALCSRQMRDQTW